MNGSETVRYELYSFQLFYDDFNDLVQQQYAEGIIQHYDYPEPCAPTGCWSCCPSC